MRGQVIARCGAGSGACHEKHIHASCPTFTQCGTLGAAEHQLHDVRQLIVGGTKSLQACHNLDLPKTLMVDDPQSFLHLYPDTQLENRGLRLARSTPMFCL